MELRAGSKLLAFYQRLIPWSVSLALYVSVIMSTAFQLTSGPEATQRLAGFYTSAVDARPQEFKDVYPDFGSLSGDARAAAALRHGENWKFSIFWTDAAYYVMQAKHSGPSIAPYRYRWLPTWLVGCVSSATGLSVELVFTLFNVCVALLTAMLFEGYLRRTYGLSCVLCLLGGVLFLTLASTVGTLTYPMLEPASMLLSCLLFITAANRNAVGFACTAVVAVATKEVLVFGAILWWVHRTESEPRWRNLLLAAVPLISFAVLRAVLGGSPLEVNYGFDVLHGQFPRYWERMLGLRSMLILVFQVFLGFFFLWMGILSAYRNERIRRESIVIPVVILAAFLFSGRIARVLAVVFPVVIPGVLLLLQEFARRTSSGAHAEGRELD